MAKKKQEDPEKAPNHERWLLTYADMITLLMTFFIVMFAMSTVTEEKYEAVRESLAAALEGMPGIQLREGQGGHAVLNTESELKTSSGTGLSSTSSKKNLIEQTNSRLKTQIDSGVVRVHTESRGVVLALSGDVFFAPEEAVVPESAVPIIQQVAEVVRMVPNPIVVEGFTDNSPTSGKGIYSSNLMLSAARAVSVAELLGAFGVDRTRLSAAGYGEYKPERPNTTAEGRAFNRRVEILIRYEAE